MTEKRIRRAIESGRAIVLRDDPLSRVCYDLFGNLVVISLRNDADPIRLATAGDMKQARMLTSK